MAYNPTIHNRQSLRLKGYDYGAEGLYFLTICTQDRLHLFGDIKNNEMQLNSSGEIAKKCWLDIPMHFPHAHLHEFVIMPNHIHGIVEITENVGIVGSKKFSALQYQPDISSQPYQPEKHGFSPAFKSPSKTIGSIVRGFKIGVTKWMRQNTTIHTIWQSNYYDHIIRNQSDYYRIAEYIIKNPQKWQTDKFNVEDGK
ncbi:MAG: transposase [Crocinitomicaceae bacterium]